MKKSKMWFLDVVCTKQNLLKTFINVHNISQRGIKLLHYSRRPPAEPSSVPLGTGQISDFEIRYGLRLQALIYIPESSLQKS